MNTSVSRAHVPPATLPPVQVHAPQVRFHHAERILRTLGTLALLGPLLVLALFLGVAVFQGFSRLNLDFLTAFPSRIATRAGILPALAGSAYLMVLTALMAIPLGVGAAAFLEEYARPGRLTRIIELSITNLAGVPSIIYGLLGLEVFVRTLGMGRSLLAGAATLALLLLPVVITVSREAMRNVPHSLREAALGLGAERWQVLRQVVLPAAAPGILTGVILSLARAVGETAPLIMVGALGYVAFVPTSLQSAFTVLPVQIFNWISRPQADFHVNAAAAIVVLLVLMAALSGVAILLRVRLERRA
ncbi:MAG: phosphate ABC transporter permease PstA [Myxococcota bacterium]